MTEKNHLPTCFSPRSSVIPHLSSHYNRLPAQTGAIQSFHGRYHNVSPCRGFAFFLKAKTFLIQCGNPFVLKDYHLAINRINATQSTIHLATPLIFLAYESEEPQTQEEEKHSKTCSSLIITKTYNTATNGCVQPQKNNYICLCLSTLYPCIQLSCSFLSNHHPIRCFTDGEALPNIT